jgi:hypothetical protein
MLISLYFGIYPYPSKYTRALQREKKKLSNVHEKQRQKRYISIYVLSFQ